MARYAIGDIQGCMEPLDRLLARLRFDRARDQLWLVGDLVNRGPRSADVLRWAMAQGDAVIAVLGNHEIHLLARFAGLAVAKPRDTLDALLGAPDVVALIDWLRRQRLCHVDDRYVMIHGGLHPQWTVGEARHHAAAIEARLGGDDWRDGLPDVLTTPALAYFTRARCCFADGTMEGKYDGPPEDAPSGTAPWFTVAPRAWATHTAVFGHWATLGYRRGDHYLALDSGCVWGRSLTAVNLDDGSVVSVPAS